MSQRTAADQTEQYEQVEAARRHAFIERMEQKWAFKAQVYRDQQRTSKPQLRQG